MPVVSSVATVPADAKDNMSVVMEQGSAGALIRRYRTAAELTQQQLADAAGVSVGVIRDLEQQRTTRPHAQTVLRLAAALRLDRDQIAALSGARRADTPAKAAGQPGLLRLSVLGPVQAWRDSEAIPIGTPQQRAVLGLLALHPGSGLRRAALIDALWGDDPPATAAAMIQSYVSRLRQLLGGSRPADLLVAASAGYRLDAAACDLDHVAFASLVSRAREADSAAAACADYARALALWRGEPLAEVDSLREHPAAVRLNLLRAEAVTEYAEAASAAGQHGRALSELQALASREPLNERAHARLMIALAGSGRQSAALALYGQLRGRLNEQLGIEPGAELADAHARVLRQDLPRPGPERAAPAAGQRPADAGAALSLTAIVPRQLPAGSAYFAGRTAELAALTTMFDAGAAASADVGDVPRGGTVVISAIDGTAGVGKTALALQFAHRLAGRFPDGQLYLNLRGFDPAGVPLRPADAVHAFLDAMQVPPAQIPAGTDAQEGLYRSLLAGRRMLIVLDNAADAAQVRPLLPGHGGCLVVVTSRRQLLGLAATHGAQLLSLDVLSVFDACELLTARLGARAAREPEAVRRLAGLCSRLPLALSIAGALAAGRPGLALADLAAELQDERRRLELLDAGDATASIRAVFSWSYDQLGDKAARMFRLLGAHPGPDITAPAAASLAGTSLGAARALLAELTRGALLSEHVPGRYAFHDLLRVYAAEQSRDCDAPEDRTAAVLRMLDHYLYTAHQAALVINQTRLPRTLSPLHQAVVPERLADFDHSMAWLSAERPVLFAAASLAAASGFDIHAWQIPLALTDFLERQGRWREAAGLFEMAAAAARRLDDAYAQAAMQRFLGEALGRLGRHREAFLQLTHSLELFAQIDDAVSQAHCHCDIAWVHELERDFVQAVNHAELAFSLYRTAGNRVGQSAMFNRLGLYYAELGKYDDALACCQQAVDLCRELGDRYAEAGALDSLGYVRYQLRHFEAARQCYQDALKILGEFHSPYHEAVVLDHLGDAQAAATDYPQAGQSWRRAEAILGELNHPEAAPVQVKLAGLSHRGSA